MLGSNGLATRLHMPLRLGVALTIAVGACAASFLAPSSVAAAKRELPAAIRGGPAAANGWDASWPQCGSSLPSNGSFGIVGVTNGRPWGANSCLGAQYSWAATFPQAPALYMNTANPNGSSSFYCYGCNSSPQSCAAPYTSAGCAYDYGWYAAQNALGTATSTGAIGAAADSETWWLDVETSNTWAGSAAANAADVQGSIDYLREAGVPVVGVYSTPSQWSAVTGGYTTGTAAAYQRSWGFATTSGLASSPDWIAGASTARKAAAYCSRSFTGVAVRLSQYPSQHFDADYRCP